MNFFFSSSKSSTQTESTKVFPVVLPDPEDQAAFNELEIQRFKWKKFLSRHPKIFEDDWIWANRIHPVNQGGVLQKKLLQIFSSKVKLRKKLKKLIRGGVPPEFRGQVWYACAGSEAKKKAASAQEQYSEVLKQIYLLDDSQIAKDVEKDLMRTFPDRIEKSDVEYIGSLRRVLYAYALRNLKIGYCQSMNYLAGLMLFHMDEEHAYWTFASLLEDIIPNNYYYPSLLGGRIDQQVFQSCIASKLPKIYVVFKNTDTLLEPIICPWFLCLYINVLPLYAVCRVWDCLFWEGSVVIFRIGLTLMKSKSHYLFKATDFISVYNILKSESNKGYSFQLESKSTAHSEDPETPRKSLVASNDVNMSDCEFMMHSAFGFRWLRSIPNSTVILLRDKFSELLKEPDSHKDDDVPSIQRLAKSRNRRSQLMTDLVHVNK